MTPNGGMYSQILDKPVSQVAAIDVVQIGDAGVTNSARRLFSMH